MQFIAKSPKKGPRRKIRMKLSLIIEPKNIVTPIEATTTIGIIEELLPHSGDDDAEVCDSFCKQLLAREEHGGTLLGGGLYFPHTRTTEGGEIRVALGLSPEGIDLDTPDGKPVKFVLLMVAPIEKNTALLKARAALIKFLIQDDCANKLLAAESSEEAHRIIRDNDVYIGDMLTVNDIVKRDVITVSSGMSLRRLLNLMFAKGIETLPVVEDGKLVGVVTGQEVLRLAIPKFADNISSLKFIESRAPFEAILQQRDEVTVSDIMEEDFLKAHTDVSLLQIAHLMATTGQRHVFIVESEDNETFVGIVSRRDLLTEVLVA